MEGYYTDEVSMAEMKYESDWLFLAFYGPFRENNILFLPEELLEGYYTIN